MLADNRDRNEDRAMKTEWWAADEEPIETLTEMVIRVLRLNNVNIEPNPDGPASAFSSIIPSLSENLPPTSTKLNKHA